MVAMERRHLAHTVSGQWDTLRSVSVRLWHGNDERRKGTSFFRLRSGSGPSPDVVGFFSMYLSWVRGKNTGACSCLEKTL